MTKRVDKLYTMSKYEVNMPDKIKVKISSFVADILENDALRFGFTKNAKSNKNALLNKLIPTLVEVRKQRRNDIERVLKDEYNRDDGERIYNAVNTVIDQVYFNDEELNILEEYLWIRPTKDAITCFDEIQTSEVYITAQETPVYIRGLLNEYCRLPQYKREALVFDSELDVFAEACYTQRILHFKDKGTGNRRKVFVYDYRYGYLYDQTNYCIIYDINGNLIEAVPLTAISDVYLIKEKYRPSDKLVEQLRNYAESCEYDKAVEAEEK